jgi:dienelactone hydrolase
MTEQSGGRPLYLDTEWGPVFGFLHPAAPGAWSGASAVIVGPWGWDEVVTYRSRRDWAGELAGSGVTALRIDLPGAGDSAGSGTDVDRVEAWSAAVSAAVAFLRQLPGSRHVAVIGMGLGGLIAGRAIEAGTLVDDLVLWAAPTSGRAFLREMRAFSGLQSVRFSLTGNPEPQLLPDGWLEVGGFVLSAGTIAALESLDALAWSFNGAGCVLLLDRDGLVDGKLRTHLEAASTDVTIASGAGWAAMCADIEHHEPPVIVFDTVRTFLADRLAEPTDAGPLDGPSPSRAATMRLGTSTIRESPVEMDHSSGRTFGVLSEPGAPVQTELAAIFLNAGAVRRIGPNRMWVDAARRWAARGIPTLRLDIEAIGDADGDPTRFVDVNAFYRAGLDAQIIAAMDLIAARGLGRRFVLVGLCSGAYWSFQVAVADDRVAAIAMFNPRTLIWDPHVFTRLASRDARKVLQRASWRRFLRGRIGPRRIAGVGRALGIRLADAARDAVSRRLPLGARPRRETLDGMLAGLDRRGTGVLLAFSDEEPLRSFFEDDGLPSRFGRWPNAAWVRLPGRDHTVRPIVAQAAVHTALDAALDRAIAARTSPVATPIAGARPIQPPPVHS